MNSQKSDASLDTPIVRDEDLPQLSARDPILPDIFPAGFAELFEVHSYRNAATILSHACGNEFAELVQHLISFRIQTAHMVAGGKNKSEIAKSMETALNPIGWVETRIQGDLKIKKIQTEEVEGRTITKGKNKGKIERKRRKIERPFMLRGFLDGHKVDFVKERVAFDMEWNSKDQTFDRDLYAMRAFYECGVISAGVLLTRSSDLAPLFAEISRRVEIDKFASKFGASTTWMGKLLYRLDAGRGGGCPILALGIRPSVVSDFDSWKSENEVVRGSVFDIDDVEDDEDAGDEE